MEDTAEAQNGDRASFSFAQCDWLGFDLDHTLIRYHVPNFENLVYDCSKRYIVESTSFPPQLRSMKYDAKFAFKGLLLDTDHGNLVKIDEGKNVTRAYHGTTLLSASELSSAYPIPLLDFEGVSDGRFVPIATFFERPAGPLYAQMIDILDQEGETDYSMAWDCIANSLYFNYASFTGDSYFFAEMRKNPLKYIFKRENDVKKWLLKLRDTGKRLFLLTNSMPDYTKLLLDTAYGRDWPDLFHFCCFHARKPHFWINEETLFEEVEYDSLTEEGIYSWKVVTENVSDPERGKMYQFGSGKKMEQLLNSITGDGGTGEICYFGDHPVSDILVTRNVMEWHTIAIMEEMEALYPNGSAFPADFNGKELQYEENAAWGSYFFDNGHRTYWKHLLRHSATLCIPCLSSLCDYEITHRYESHEEHMLHPCALLQREIPSYTIYYKQNEKVWLFHGLASSFF